ncbi:MAG: hypothetical protein ACRECO_15935 [Xanthobacteraceae bacterium]
MIAILVKFESMRAGPGKTARIRLTRDPFRPDGAPRPPGAATDDSPFGADAAK